MQARVAFSSCAARIPHSPERAVTSVKEPGAAHALGSLICVSRRPGMHSPMERSAAQFVLLTMSERATTKLIGLSLSGLFLMMLMLNAISS